MGKSNKILITIAALLAVAATICSCQTAPETSASTASSITSSSCASGTEENDTNLKIEEEIMPELDKNANIYSKNEKYNFFGIGYEKAGTIPLEIEAFIEENYPDEVWEEYSTWCDENDNPYYNKEKPVNIKETPNLPNIVRKYSLDHDKVSEILNKRRESYKKLIESGTIDNDPELIYTDEEIEIIASGDVEKFFDLFDYAVSIRKDDLIYTPAYIYNNAMDKLEEAGITAEEIAERAERFTEFNLTNEQMTAFQNKMLKYVALQAEKGNFSGTYNIPSAATFSVPEKIGNATFVKSA